MNYLSRILQAKQEDVRRLQAGSVMEDYRRRAAALPLTRNWVDALRRPAGAPLRLIAELKKASPSRGVLIENFNPAALATAYHALGAAAFSVLTDEPFFQGAAAYLQTAREVAPLPALRKDFIIDALQLYESRLMGADAVLLIVAALSEPQLGQLLALAHRLGMDTLIETHSEPEIQIACRTIEKFATRTPVIGINNRNLEDFTLDVSLSIKLRSQIPNGVLAVSESGLKTADDLLRIEDAGFDAVLIGEGLIEKKSDAGETSGTSLRSYPWKAVIHQLMTASAHDGSIGKHGQG